MSLDKDVVEILESLFKQMEKTEGGFVKTIEFLNEIRSHQRYLKIAGLVGREKSDKFNLPTESVEETLNRIEKEADDFIEWTEFMEFFTRRGRPKYSSSHCAFILVIHF